MLLLGSTKTARDLNLSFVCAVLLCLVGDFFINICTYMCMYEVYELMVSLFIRCTMRCEIWAQPDELPW